MSETLRTAEPLVSRRFTYVEATFSADESRNIGRRRTVARK